MSVENAVVLSVIAITLTLSIFAGLSLFIWKDSSKRGDD